MGKSLYLLFECSSGYALMLKTGGEVIGQSLAEVQQTMVEPGSFGKVVELRAFLPFSSPEEALANANDISEGIASNELQLFLEQNLPKGGCTLGVADDKLGATLSGLGISCAKNKEVAELLRGCRMHLTSFIPDLKGGMLERAQLGLGHAYSRAKVKFNVNRADNMIIQAINLLDQLDKDINTFSMRMREWYSYGFPELAKLVPDAHKYARVVQFVKDKMGLSKDPESVDKLADLLGNDDRETAEKICDAARSSMGQDIGPVDMINIERFSARVIALAEYRVSLYTYLTERMSMVAPSLSALIGEMVGARLIAHAGSLVNLAKCPASTVQILGAEKALFRALKTKGNTPKYGLIFHSTFIGRAAAKNKGRISRYLANKCAIAARLDAFSDVPTPKFGEMLREQVEERLKFYDTGETPRKNVDAMRQVINDLVLDDDAVEKDNEEPVAPEVVAASSSSKSKKRKASSEPVGADTDGAPSSAKKAKKEKKKKKKKKKEKKE